MPVLLKLVLFTLYCLASENNWVFWETFYHVSKDWFKICSKKRFLIEIFNILINQKLYEAPLNGSKHSLFPIMFKKLHNYFITQMHIFITQMHIKFLYNQWEQPDIYFPNKLATYTIICMMEENMWP